MRKLAPKATLIFLTTLMLTAKWRLGNETRLTLQVAFHTIYIILTQMAYCLVVRLIVALDGLKQGRFTLRTPVEYHLF